MGLERGDAHPQETVAMPHPGMQAERGRLPRARLLAHHHDIYRVPVGRSLANLISYRHKHTAPTPLNVGVAERENDVAFLEPRLLRGTLRHNLGHNTNGMAHVRATVRFEQGAGEPARGKFAGYRALLHARGPAPPFAVPCVTCPHGL
jgi:hypothetical protein